MTTTTELPWRLDIGSAHGWMLIRPGDALAAAEAQQATSDAHYAIVGAPTRIFDPRVGPALAYPIAPFVPVPRMREPGDMPGASVLG